MRGGAVVLVVRLQKMPQCVARMFSWEVAIAGLGGVDGRLDVASGRAGGASLSLMNESSC